MPILRFVRDKSADAPAITAGRGEPIPFVAVTGGLKGDGINTADLPWSFGRGELRDSGWSRFPLLWVHDFGGQRLPLGVTDVRMRNDGTTIEANAIFDPDDRFAVEVERKYLSDVGGLRGFSASWDDIDGNGVPVRGAGGRAVAHELLEVSAVPVGLDPLAIKGGRGLPQSLVRLRSLIDALESADDDAEPTTADDANALADVSLPEGDLAPRIAPQDGCYFSEKGGCECEGECQHPDQRQPPGERSDNAADAADDAAEDEDAGDDLAAEMVAVFDPESDESDAVRGRRYRALLPGYRRMGWTAPELLPADELAALDGDVWRGMFVSGELERLERVGKEISAANLAGLKDALAQLESGVGALKTMVKRVDSGTERAAADEPTAEDIARAIMDSMTVRITNELR